MVKKRAKKGVIFLLFFWAFFEGPKTRNLGVQMTPKSRIWDPRFEGVPEGPGPRVPDPGSRVRDPGPRSPQIWGLSRNLAKFRPYPDFLWENKQNGQNGHFWPFCLFSLWKLGGTPQKTEKRRVPIRKKGVLEHFWQKWLEIIRKPEFGQIWPNLAKFGRFEGPGTLVLGVLGTLKLGVQNPQFGGGSGGGSTLDLGGSKPPQKSGKKGGQIWSNFEQKNR